MTGTQVLQAEVLCCNTWANVPDIIRYSLAYTSTSVLFLDKSQIIAWGHPLFVYVPSYVIQNQSSK